jgi:hypothetical protein
MKYALSQKSASDRARLYALGAGTLADAMGEAASARGAQTAKFWMHPSEGEVRIDMPMESWIAIRYMADTGFQHKMPNFREIMPRHFRSKEDAEKAEAALEKLESAVRHSERLIRLWEMTKKKKGPKARSQASLMEAARVQEPTFRKSQSSLRLIAAARFIDLRASTNELRSLLEKPAFENDALFNCAGFASPR